jgi:hypothetical protein
LDSADRYKENPDQTVKPVPKKKSSPSKPSRFSSAVGQTPPHPRRPSSATAAESTDQFHVPTKTPTAPLAALAAAVQAKRPAPTPAGWDRAESNGVVGTSPPRKRIVMKALPPGRVVSPGESAEVLEATGRPLWPKPGQRLAHPFGACLLFSVGHRLQSGPRWPIASHLLSSCILYTPSQPVTFWTQFDMHSAHRKPCQSLGFLVTADTCPELYVPL